MTEKQEPSKSSVNQKLLDKIEMEQLGLDDKEPLDEIEEHQRQYIKNTRKFKK